MSEPTGTQLTLAAMQTLGKPLFIVETCYGQIMEVDLTERDAFQRCENQRNGYFYRVMKRGPAGSLVEIRRPLPRGFTLADLITRPIKGTRT